MFITKFTYNRQNRVVHSFWYLYDVVRGFDFKLKTFEGFVFNSAQTNYIFAHSLISIDSFYGF